MADATKDLAELRKEHKELSDHSGRLAIVFLTVLTLLGISFSRAWNKVNSADAENLVCQIVKFKEENLHERQLYDCEIDVSYVFEPTVEKYEAENHNEKNCASCPKVMGVPTPTPTPSPPCDCQTRLAQKEKDAKEKKARDEESERRRVQREYDLAQGLQALPLPTSTPTPTPLPASEDPVCQCQKQFERELEAKAAVWFATKLPIPGVDLTIDIRAWVFLLPVLFSLCGLYLYILRKKQHLLWAVGNKRLRESKPGDVTELDRLHFEGEAPFHRFPSKLTTVLFVAFYLFMPAYVAYRAWDSWYRGGGAILLFLPLPVICVAYATAYGRHVKRKFEAQIAAITKVEPRHRMEPLKWLARTVNPAITLATGSALVLLSLLLPVTKISFWSPRRFSGFKLLFDKTGLGWVTTHTQSYSRFAHGIYSASLLLAIVILLLLLLFLVPLVRSWVKRKWVSALAFALTSSILAFFLIDLTLGVFSFFDIRESSIISANLVVWFISILWIFVSAGKMASNETQFQKYLRTLTVVFAPTILISVGLVLWLELPGLVVLIVGLLLLVLGFIQAQYRVNTGTRSDVEP